MVNDRRSTSGAKRLTPTERQRSLLGDYRAMEALSYRYPPFNPNALIQRKGYDALDKELENVPVLAALNIIRTAVLRKGVSVQSGVAEPNDPDFEAAAQIRDHLQFDVDNILTINGNRQSLRKVCWQLLYAIHVGFRVTEIVWRVHETGMYAGKWGFARFAPKTAKQIGFDLDDHTGEVLNIRSHTPLEGHSDLPPEKAIVYSFASNDETPYGQAVGRTVYKHSWSFEFLPKFWNMSLETYGSPNLKTTAPAGLIEQVREVIEEIRQGAPFVLPEGTNSEMLQATPGAFDGFERACMYHSQQIMLCYLHNTLSAGEGRRTGSLAMAKVHQDTGQWSLQFVREDTEETLNQQVAARWYAYNYGADADPRLCPEFSLGEWDELDSLALATAFETLIRMGTMDAMEPVIRDRLKLPPPDPETRRRLEERHSAAHITGNQSNPAQGG